MRPLWRNIAFIAGAALAGCTEFTPEPPPPTTPGAGVEIPALPQPSARSQELTRFYARVQQDLLTRGLLRQDGGGPDTPYNARMLSDNFINIALHNEYEPGQSLLRQGGGQSPLRKWERPVRFGLHFSETVPDAQQAEDRRNVENYVARLARVTRAPMSVTPTSSANFHVFFINEDDRRALGPTLSALVPGISASSISSITRLPRQFQCLVVAFSPVGSFSYTHAVAIVRAEHADLMRLSCIHEELAQGLGLANDSPRARPSIFNDDEEFALLTSHDELLLQILYDPRMSTGMTLETAGPLARTIAAEFFDGQS